MTQDLIELFLKYQVNQQIVCWHIMIKMLYCVLDARRQVPGDMLAYQGKNNVAVETKLAAVRSQVGAMQALIDKVRSCGRVAFVELSSSYVCDLLF